MLLEKWWMRQPMALVRQESPSRLRSKCWKVRNVWCSDAAIEHPQNWENYHRIPNLDPCASRTASHSMIPAWWERAHVYCKAHSQKIGGDWSILRLIEELKAGWPTQGRVEQCMTSLRVSLSWVHDACGLALTNEWEGPVCFFCSGRDACSSG